MHDISYLRDIIILLFASVAMVIFFKQLKLSPVLGYLVSGALIGPHGFGLLQGQEIAESIAELGIVFLLFAIGLELTLDKLKAMRKYVLGFGSLQVLLSAAFISFAVSLIIDDVKVAVLIGAALALSSTAMVLQVINENSESGTRVGRLSFSVLILQDLAVIPILVLLPLLSNPDVSLGSALLGAFFNASIALIIIFIVGRLFLRPIYRVVVDLKSDVLFLSTTLIVVLGSAFISHHLGLSFALGAFVAGLMVAETEFKYRVESEILSLKSLLMGLFFMTIGMSFEIELLIDKLEIIILAAAGLIIAKATIIVFLCRVFKFPFGPSIHSGLLLAQGGEFAFVVFLMAVDNNIIGAELSQLLMTIVTLTMAVTPLMAHLGRKIKSNLYVNEVLKDSKLKREVGDVADHVIIIGFGKIGRIIANVLKMHQVNYLILDSNYTVVRSQKEKGYNIYCGDATNRDILNCVNISEAKSVVIAHEEEFSCLRIARIINDNFPHVEIITKSDNIRNGKRFKRFGVNKLVAKNLEAALQISRNALKSVNLSKAASDKSLDEIRDIDSDFVKNIILEEEDRSKDSTI